MKILFLVPYPTEGASNRIRVEQFIPFLNSKGIATRVRPFVNKRFYRILYLPHRYFEKIFWFILCTFNRIFDIIRSLNYDIIFIHREAYPIGGAFIETVLYGMGKPIIYDFDDAIFISNTSEHNIYIERLKNPAKTAKIVRMSRRVIVGNDYLKKYALGYNPNVEIIPSSVDTEKYKPAAADAAVDSGKVVIGWIGSDTTKRFLSDLESVFERLSSRYENIVFKMVGMSRLNLGLKNIINKRWSLDEEIDDLHSFDIGIMPMPDDAWTEGKCGFKAILYMACGIPVIASPVGINQDIVEDGVNGFFGKDADDWYRKLSILIEDKKLRQEMGKNGREKVVEKYSLSYVAPILYENIMKVADGIKR